MILKSALECVQKRATNRFSISGLDKWPFDCEYLNSLLSLSQSGQFLVSFVFIHHQAFDSCNRRDGCGNNRLDVLLLQQTFAAYHFQCLHVDKRNSCYFTKRNVFARLISVSLMLLYFHMPEMCCKHSRVNSNRLKCDRVHKLSIMKWRINHGVITDYSSYHRQMFYSRLSNIVYHPIVTTNISHAYLHY